MGATGSKVSDIPEETQALEPTGAPERSEAVNLISGKIQAPPKRENPTMHALKTYNRTGEKVTADRWPTMEEIEDTEKSLRYRKDRLHFAICGSTGSGKSSLINAFRGIEAWNPGAAPIGFVQATTSTARYPDTRSGMPYELFVWHEIPCPDTVSATSSQYFTEQGLYIFDFVVLVYDTRFTEMDAKILEDCHKFGVPVFIVRSKASQRIQSMCDNGDFEYPAARDHYINETRHTLEDYLAAHELHGTARCYMVSNDRLHSLIKSAEATVSDARPTAWRRTEQDIDEEQLLVDLFKTVLDRRYKQPLSSPPVNKRSLPYFTIVSQISAVTGIDAAQLFDAIEAIMHILSRFHDPKRVIEEMCEYPKEHPYRTAFFVVSFILALNPVALAGFGSAGVSAGSPAAALQATMGRNIAAGSSFAILQSIGAKHGVLIRMLGVGGLAVWLLDQTI